jgi:4-guanidinobutyraldehyde dehydrogenase/NAD-dependent aldehyde dehydrogenase
MLDHKIILSLAYINGKYTQPLSETFYDIINPATGQHLATIADCGVNDVELAVQAARDAFEIGIWSQAHPATRKKILLNLASLMESELAEFAWLETLNTGKPITESSQIDLPTAINALRWYAEFIDKDYHQLAPSAQDTLAFIKREPLGVVGLIVPYNFPLLIAMYKLAPALATGNSIILKPADQTPLTVLKLAQLAQRAGIPAGVFNVLPGKTFNIGKLLALHHDVDGISFTGSTAVGKKIMQYSGFSNLKKIALECGGKSPVIIFDDYSNLKKVATETAFNAFFNQGAVCCAASRVLVHHSIHDVFVKELIAATKKFIPDNPLLDSTQMGAIIDQHHFGKINQHIAQAINEGATIAYQGQCAENLAPGFYIAPIIFTDVKSCFSIAQTEIFGPVLSVMKFIDEEEAIAIANDTIYGLTASLWTSDIARANKISQKIKAGTVSINTISDGNMATPFGGYKQSGSARDKSLEAVQQYTHSKTTWFNLTN